MPTLSQALDSQLADLQERASLIRAELNKASERVARTCQVIIDAPTLEVAAGYTLPGFEIARIHTLQSRLDEVMQAYGALSALRANYASEIAKAH